MGLNNFGVTTDDLVNTSSLGPSSYLDATFSSDTDSVGPSSKVSYLDATFSSDTNSEDHNEGEPSIKITSDLENPVECDVNPEVSKNKKYCSFLHFYDIKVIHINHGYMRTKNFPACF